MPNDDRYRDLGIEGREKERLEWLGTTSPGDGAAVPVYLDPRTDEVFRTEVVEDEDHMRVVPESVRSTEESSLADVIRDIGDELGWERLSEFGEEHN
ncbi:hypothetical protein [Salarchaeum sp. JOR-1]|uniref:hypothetical protein n=1 Tax=Salarchaeum sp. JOR-1 TaxID=2599399 RepID=UPI001198A540|nr:hypothetical protein [Salarchaeum sp. JOR-1]QDX41045.1 hypothetical protein FQU85_09100 [Salarchaeum sp. JOR-1]